MKKYWPLIVIVIIGAALRYYHNLDISLWHDEAFSALMIRYPWGEMFYRLGLDVHPPAYYVFLRIWHYAFGDSLLSLRSMSVFFGTATIWAAYAFVAEAFKNEKAALWAAILIAINPFQLQYVTEARMYTMGAFFALLCAYFLVKALNAQHQLVADDRQNIPNLPQDITLKRKTRWYYVGFTVSLIIIIYTHYYLFFTAAALGLYGLIYLIYHYRRNYKHYISFLVSCLLALISFLPWLPTFLSQLKSVGQSYWIPPMNKWSIPSTFWDMLLGLAHDITKSSTQIWLVAITLFSLYLFYRFARKTQSFHKWLVLLAVLAPFAGSLMFLILARLKGSSSSVYLDRYFLFASIFYSVALAVWLKELPYKRISVTLFLAYCALNLGVFWHYWSDLNVQTKTGMAGAAKFLTANVEPTHKIFVGSSFEFFNFKYYWTQKNPSEPGANLALDGDTKYYFISNVHPLLYTGGRSQASQMSSVEGSALLVDADLQPVFSNGVARGDTIWLVWTNGFGGSKPGVPKNWTQVDEKGFADVRPYVGTWIVVDEYKVN